MSDISDEDIVVIQRFIKRLEEPWVQALLLELAGRELPNADIIVGVYLRALNVSVSWQRSSHHTFATAPSEKDKAINSYPAIAALWRILNSYGDYHDQGRFIASEELWYVALQDDLDEDGILEQLGKAWKTKFRPVSPEE